MTNYKKQLDLITKLSSNTNDFIKQLSVINSVLNCELLTEYESLIKRPIKESELNVVCDYIYNFNSNLNNDLIVYNLFILLTETEDFEISTSVKKSQFRLNDLKDSDKTEQITNTIIDMIRDCVDDYDYLF